MNHGILGIAGAAGVAAIVAGGIYLNVRRKWSRTDPAANYASNRIAGLLIAAAAALFAYIFSWLW
jgi:hypothetical protein